VRDRARRGPPGHRPADDRVHGRLADGPGPGRDGHRGARPGPVRVPDPAGGRAGPAGGRVPRAAAQRGGGAMIVRQAGIPLPDGTGLAATLYLPDDADTTPVPVLLEYLPYRKDDAMLARDHDLYAYMARAGYAGARVDIRGTGRSGGTLPGGEYTETEQRDGETVIAWLASQPWCTGAVGMWGISWGGFNSIQIASRQPAPPALKAIIAVEA